MSNTSSSGKDPENCEQSSGASPRKTSEPEYIEPEKAIEVLRAHMSALRSSTDWGIWIAITTLFLAVSEVEFEIFGFATSDLWAYHAAACVYLIVITVLGCQLLRLGYFLEITKKLVGKGALEANRIALVVPIITYPWFFNPFTYCGGLSPEADRTAGEDEDENGQILRNIVGSAGGVALILAWWAGFIGLNHIYSNLNRPPLETLIEPLWHVFICILMLAAGLFLLFAIWSVLCVLSKTLILTRPPEGIDYRLAPYEETVAPKLRILAAAQIVMIVVSFLCFATWMSPGWWSLVITTVLVSVFLEVLAEGFPKKIDIWQARKEKEEAEAATEKEANDGLATDTKKGNEASKTGRKELSDSE